MTYHEKIEKHKKMYDEGFEVYQKRGSVQLAFDEQDFMKAKENLSFKPQINEVYFLIM